ncbi:MAG: molybdopterin-containing oxidoreductase family protein [Candidatus Nitrospinota bacterium M3_3B_026]
MDRRTFLKFGGAAAAAGLTGSCGQVAQKIIPYVIPPDEGINPVEGWYFNTACGMCGQGCGVMIRVVEGRAKKVEGNPAHPMNRGGVCAMGQAAVQQVYHPERIQKPLRRKGGKGMNSFEPISWDDAFSILAEKMKKAAGGKVFVIADDGSGAPAAVASRFLESAGSRDFIVPDMRGGVSFPTPDISDAAVAMLFGADILESGFPSVNYGFQFGAMRRGSPVRRGMMIYAGPRMSMTAASADRFIAARPGTLGTLALGVLGEAAGEAGRRGVLDADDVALYGRLGMTALEAAAKTGVPAERIKEAARLLVENPPAFAIPGDDVAFHSNGLASVRAVEALDLLLSRLGGARRRAVAAPPRDGGLYEDLKKFLGVPPDAQDPGKLRAVIGKMMDGGMELGIVMGANPVHGLPPSLKMAEALSKTGFMAATGLFLNDTTRYADLVFPESHFLESWSASIFRSPQGEEGITTRQPVMRPLYDTMAAGDIIARAAAVAGLDAGEGQEEAVRSMVRSLRPRLPVELASMSDKKIWERMLQDGGWRQRWDEGPGGDAKPPERIEIEAPAFSGGGEFHLIPYHTIAVGGGGAANLPWILEKPDPMTTLMWGSWVEINPKTAARLGVDNGDVVRVESPHGFIEAPVYIYPGIAPEAAALPFGYGHESYGKYASGRGANAMRLLGDFFVEGSRTPAWRGVKVKITRTGGKIGLAREGHPEGEYEGEVFQL